MDGDGGHRAVEADPRLRHREKRVRVGPAVAGGGEHGQPGAACAPARVGRHRDPEGVEDTDDGQRGRQVGIKVLQFKPDRPVALGVQGEQLGAEPGGRLAVQAAVRHHDALVQQPFVQPARPFTLLDPDPGGLDRRVRAGRLRVRARLRPLRVCWALRLPGREGRPGRERASAVGDHLQTPPLAAHGLIAACGFVPAYGWSPRAAVWLPPASTLPMTGRSPQLVLPTAGQPRSCQVIWLPIAAA